jgi:hypothetical protein
VIRHDEPVVMRTLAFVVLRQIFGLVGCGRSPDVKDVEKLGRLTFAAQFDPCPDRDSGRRGETRERHHLVRAGHHLASTMEAVLAVDDPVPAEYCVPAGWRRFRVLASILAALARVLLAHGRWWLRDDAVSCCCDWRTCGALAADTGPQPVGLANSASVA